jgi:hypothetical protein
VTTAFLHPASNALELREILFVFEIAYRSTYLEELFRAFVFFLCLQRYFFKCSSSRCEALGSISSTGKKKKQQQLMAKLMCMRQREREG